jgi:PIN domain nuclease of toxin-antitoxin system
VRILDTCVLIFDALAPEKLSTLAAAELDKGRAAEDLACSDISLWEIAMLAHRGRITFSGEVKGLLHDIVLANRLTVLPVSPEIAVLSADDGLFTHKDPADRIIAATAICNKAPLITCDGLLQGIRGLKTIW